MVKNKVFDYGSETLEYGFISTDNQHSLVSFQDILGMVRESLILVDTKNFFLMDSLKTLSNYLNQDELLLIGLVDNASLLKLKDNGVSNGFFRSTEESFETGVIIVDKKKAFLAIDANHIYEILSKEQSNEIFEFVNHIIWSRTDYERCQTTMKKVEETRLSVVCPPLSFAGRFVQSETYLGASDNLSCTKKINFLNKEEDHGKPARVLFKPMSCFVKQEGLFSAMLFRDCFYTIKDSNSLYKAKCFINEKRDSLAGKEIWYKGKKVTVLSSDIVNKHVFVPLDQLSLFEPDFDAYENEYDGLSCELVINVDVESIKADSSYLLSPRYQKIAQIEQKISESIKKIKSMLNDDDKKAIKQTESIQSERHLPTKIRMYNEFISDKNFGLESLNNKKENFSVININEDEILVPNEIIGKLLLKAGKNYLATSEDRIKEASSWIKEAKIEATLIRK